ncbi:polyketide synthase [Lunatimonas salinarum]|uniref:polyketide synthase n=1 Tax=Lunatimonas salinarum TaxID=1774590 RepID=UPI001ADFDA82|nr:polyketide synthase [Lunatimonas salinarum]
METEKINLYVHEMVEQMVGKRGEHEAVVFRSESLTYQQLDEKANGLGAEILVRYPHESLIGISTTRHLDLLVGILAILKAGKAYVPLDPNYPRARIEQILGNSNLKAVVCLEEEFSFFRALGCETIALNGDSFPSYTKPFVAFSQPDACILYTSGSTGTPKGVCVPHAGLVNFLEHHIKTSEARAGSKTAQFCHIGFDVSMDEIFVPLVTGGTVYLLDNELRLDSKALLDYIVQEEINRLYLPFVELQYFAEEAVRSSIFPASLTEITTAGETLKITPPIRTLFSQLDGCRFNNKYGPTETCIYVTGYQLPSDPSTWEELPCIGKPFAGVKIHILDEHLKEVPFGHTGEICVSGVSVANGYLHNPELTAVSFLPWADGDTKTKLYRTGDLGRWLEDGNIQFEGRRDQQVKIRGNRIEISEIEIALMQMPSVSQAVVVAREEVVGNKYLAAYIVMEAGEMEIEALQAYLQDRLPVYMIPSFFIQMEELPKTSSGKVDRKLLPVPIQKRPALKTLFRNPATVLEKQLAEIVRTVLGFDQIGADDHFFELGGNSLLAQKVVAEIFHQLGRRLPIARLYQSPTVGGMAAFFEPRSFHSGNKKRANLAGGSPKGIAIIGMAGRFPGADTLEDFWRVLADGEETITFFDDSELDPSVSEQLRKDPTYVKARGVINGVEDFDPGFFGINAKLAALMDPQQRIFLQVAWEALEDGGYFPQYGHDQIGVFAGCYTNNYYINHVIHHPDLIQQVGAFQVATVNEKDYIASRTAYHLDLKGPAVSVFSACSTSLLAIAQAVDAIRSGKCAMALAGGASVSAPYKVGHRYEEGSMLSADGHCKPFQKGSTGTLFNDGAGAVLLKDLDEAVRDHDFIYGVIKGVGVNNDGGEKGSFTAPSAAGQAGSIRMALEDAEIDPRQIQYVEAHGTGTPIGDPIEVEGLRIAFGVEDRFQYCALGSVKSNIGHLTAAAGVAGTIKTALALTNKSIPPSLGFETPNPSIDFSRTPFFVNAQKGPWPQADQRFAGVSSFGVGGTNVHLVLEGFDNLEVNDPTDRRVHLICWSAKSEGSLERYRERLRAFLIEHPETPLEKIAATLHTKRAGFNHRACLVAASVGDLIDQLGSKSESSIKSNVLTRIPGDMVFTFPGQGAQYPNMGKELYLKEPVYREAVDTCAEVLEKYLNEDIRQVLYPASGSRLEEERLNDTKYTQPAIFVTSYALARLWMHWGIRPSALCGHSIGEFVAAHLAGVLSLEDALHLVSVRGNMVSQLPKGSMLSVRMEPDQLRRILPDSLSIAAINSPNAVVVSGEDELVASFSKILDQQEIPNRVLATSHAFHSHMMDPIVPDFLALVQRIPLSRPNIPIISTVTGTWIKESEAMDPAYWANHLRQTVRFSDAMATLATMESPLLVEVGPGTVTSSLARQQIGRNVGGIFHSIERTAADNTTGLLQVLGDLWLEGLLPDWKGFYGSSYPATCKLPHYAFEQIRCWVEPGKLKTVSEPSGIHSEKPVATKVDSGTTAPPATNNSDSLKGELLEILENSSGLPAERIQMEQSFLQQGFDSLLLTQLAFTLKKAFQVPVSFRQLSEQLSTPGRLLDYLRASTQEAVSVQENAEIQPSAPSFDPSCPPVANARLGLDQDGNPAWFLEDEKNPGNYLQLT